MNLTFWTKRVYRNTLSLFHFFLIILSLPVFAQGTIKNSRLIVNAEYSNTDMKSKTTTLKGNVQIAFRGQHLSCDKAVIDYKNQKIEATGNIRLQSQNLYAEATQMNINYEAETATLENGFIQSGQVVFEGAQIEKIGPNTYVASEARYTACASCPAAWSFSGRRIEAELGGYAKISRPVLRVGGVPVIILPGILVPLRSARQSGLLVPSLKFSGKGGVAIALSYFWAISPSEDLTLTGKYYEFRGLKGIGDYRYVLSPDSKGELAGAFMQDRSVKKEFETESDVSRWFLNYNHYYALPDNFIQRASIRQTSDLRYLRDFPDEASGHGDPGLQNKLSLTKNFHSQHISIEASHHVNLLKSYPLSPNNDAVHKFPEIKYSVIESKVLNTPIQFKFNANYTNFTRAGFSYDDLTISGSCAGGVTACAQVGPRGDIYNDGQFDTGTDHIRTGQRLDLKPSLSLPFRVFQNIEIVPEVMYRETQYRFAIDPVTTSENYARTASQRYLETTLVARTTFSNVYGDLSSSQSRRIKHEVEPEITFSTIPWIRRPDHGFFGEFAGQRYSRIFEPISDSDLYGKNRLQFDYNDRVFDKQLLDIAITNRLIKKIWRDGFPDYDRILNFRLSQSYDFYESRNAHPQPWSNINALLNMRFEKFETYTSAAYNPYAKVTNTSARVKVFNRYGNYLQASYERIYLVDEKNNVINRNQTENIGMGLGLRSKYLDLEGQLDYSSVSSKVLAWQYVADIKPHGNCWVIKIGQHQVIGGDPEFSFNMAFDFGGEQVKKLN